MEAAQDRLLALVGVALRLGAMAPGGLEPFEAPLGHRQVGQDELEVQPLQVTPRVDGAFRVGHRRILEGAHDMEQGVGIAQAGEVLGRQLLGPDPAFGRRRRGGQVDVRDVGLDDLLRPEDLGETIESLVGDLDHADVELEPTEATGLGVAAGEGVEDGRLARGGKPHDGDLHGTDCGRPKLAAREAVRLPVQYPMPGSTTLSSGSPAA